MTMNNKINGDQIMNVNYHKYYEENGLLKGSNWNPNMLLVTRETIMGIGQT